MDRDQFRKKRIGLLVAFVLHIALAVRLTLRNRAARPERYVYEDTVQATFASRTMIWSGLALLAFVIFHLLDLTWGPANPDFVHGDPYHNLIESFQRVPVALVYIAANIALAIHLYAVYRY